MGQLIVGREIQKVTIPFLPFYILYLRAISEYKPPGAYIWRGNLTEGYFYYFFFFCVWSLGAYFRNFTVPQMDTLPSLTAFLDLGECWIHKVVSNNIVNWPKLKLQIIL